MVLKYYFLCFAHQTVNVLSSTPTTPITFLVSCEVGVFKNYRFVHLCSQGKACRVLNTTNGSLCRVASPKALDSPAEVGSSKCVC